MCDKKRLEDFDHGQLSGRTILVRADLNVPMQDGEIADDHRLLASLPTLSYRTYGLPSHRCSDRRGL